MNPIAKIYINRLIDNFHYINSHIGNSNIFAVVKANAYGHGAIKVAKTLEKVGAYGLCVAMIEELIQIREAKINTPILHLGILNKNYIDLYQSKENICTINSKHDIDIINSFLKGTNKKIYCHLKVDTGMGRMGICIEDLSEMIDELLIHDNIIIEGLYSHFSTAEENNVQYRDSQLDTFKKIVLQIKKKLPSVKYFHIANSAAILTCKKSWFNMVRPGLSIYGVSPLGECHAGLIPVMQMKAPVSLIKKIKKGSFIGYGRQYAAKKNEKMFIIQAGYADGIPTEFSNKGKIEINNILYSIIGKVSMDLIAVHDHVGEVQMDQEVIFWGSNSLRLELLSKEYDKIPYEFLTGVSKRVERIYIDE